ALEDQVPGRAAAVAGTARDGAPGTGVAGMGAAETGAADARGGTDETGAAASGAAGAAVVPGATDSLATSVLSASSSACFVITTMLMRRLIGFWGSALSNRTDEDSPTTREILLSGRPAAVSARRAALARSADSSQLV